MTTNRASPASPRNKNRYASLKGEFFKLPEKVAFGKLSGILSYVEREDGVENMETLAPEKAFLRWVAGNSRSCKKFPLVEEMFPRIFAAAAKGLDPRDEKDAEIISRLMEEEAFVACEKDVPNQEVAVRAVVSSFAETLRSGAGSDFEMKKSAGDDEDFPKNVSRLAFDFLLEHSPLLREFGVEEAFFDILRPSAWHTLSAVAGGAINSTNAERYVGMCEHLRIEKPLEIDEWLGRHVEYGISDALDTSSVRPPLSGRCSEDTFPSLAERFANFLSLAGANLVENTDSPSDLHKAFEGAGRKDLMEDVAAKVFAGTLSSEKRASKFFSKWSGFHGERLFRTALEDTDFLSGGEGRLALAVLRADEKCFGHAEIVDDVVEAAAGAAPELFVAMFPEAPWKNKERTPSPGLVLALNRVYGDDGSNERFRRMFEVVKKMSERKPPAESSWLFLELAVDSLILAAEEAEGSADLENAMRGMSGWGSVFASMLDDWRQERFARAASMILGGDEEGPECVL